MVVGGEGTRTIKDGKILIENVVCIPLADGAGKKVRNLSFKREADVMRRLPERGVTSVAGSSRARLAIDSGHFANAAGPEWNVPCPWYGHFCHEHRQRHDVTSLRFRDVPPPCCVLPSWCFLICWPKNVGYCQYGPHSGIRNRQ